MGIDPSLTSMGVSLFAPGDSRHLTVLYKPKFSGARRLDDLRNFTRKISRLAQRNFGLQEIVLEGYSFASKSLQHKIGEGGAALKLGLIDGLGVDEQIAYPTIVTPQALKKFITGSGKGDKNQIPLAVFKKWGVDFPKDDMVDAYALARVGEALLSGATKHKYEQDVVNALERNTEWSPPT